MPHVCTPPIFACQIYWMRTYGQSTALFSILTRWRWLWKYLRCTMWLNAIAYHFSACLTCDASPRECVWHLFYKKRDGYRVPFLKAKGEKNTRIINRAWTTTKYCHLPVLYLWICISPVNRTKPQSINLMHNQYILNSTAQHRAEDCRLPIDRKAPQQNWIFEQYFKAMIHLSQSDLKTKSTICLH